LLETTTKSPAANPTTSSYNASAVKIYNATSSLVRFEINGIFCYFEERSSLLHTALAKYIVANSVVVNVVGLAYD
jgi:hypothetical protein